MVHLINFHITHTDTFITLNTRIDILQKYNSSHAKLMAQIVNVIVLKYKKPLENYTIMQNFNPVFLLKESKHSITFFLLMFPLCLENKYQV